MRNEKWSETVAQVLPYVVKIETPDAYGSGFLITYQPDGKHTGVAIATAAHVVKHADHWREVIRVTNASGQVILKPDYYTVVSSDSRDLALLQFVNDDLLKFPSRCLPWCSEDEILPSGSPVGWCGIPNIAADHCCFFSGTVSAAYAESGDYLVDGVVIHGVSGGPAFVNRDNKPCLVGLVSAYMPNQATGEALPGLGFIASIAPMVGYFASENKVVRAEKRKALARMNVGMSKTGKNKRNSKARRVTR